MHYAPEYSETKQPFHHKKTQEFAHHWLLAIFESMSLQKSAELVKKKHHLNPHAPIIYRVGRIFFRTLGLAAQLNDVTESCEIWMTQRRDILLLRCKFW